MPPRGYWFAIVLVTSTAYLTTSVHAFQRARSGISAADLIVAHHLKQLAVKHAELLAQDPAGDQQRFDDRGQIRMVRDQLTNSSLKLNRAHHANLEAEIAQRAT